jgi:hypothetical protein
MVLPLAPVESKSVLDELQPDVVMSDFAFPRASGRRGEYSFFVPG